MSSLFSVNRWIGVAYEQFTGQSIETFRFIPGTTTLSTFKQSVGFCAAYVCVIFSIKYLMRERKPIESKFLFRIHNFFLSILSLTLLLGFLEEMIPAWFNNGFFYAICSKQALTPQVEFLLYINYLTKYYELIDTLFLVFGKKDLKFLHWYHHAMTAILCQVQLESQTITSWTVVSLNLFVHVIMYYYYFLTTLNIRVWWKKYITVIQIIQFVLDITIISLASYTYIAFNYHPTWPNWGNCHGDLWAASFGAGLLASYLLLFIKFFITTYNKPKVAKKTVEPKKEQ